MTLPLESQMMSAFDVAQEEEFRLGYSERRADTAGGMRRGEENGIGWGWGERERGRRERGGL